MTELSIEPISAERNREPLRAPVRSASSPVGLVAYAAGLDPDEAARGAGAGSPASGDDLGDEWVWAITCFVVKVGCRRRGIATALLARAVAVAREQGASAVVAIRSTSPDGPAPAGR